MCPVAGDTVIATFTLAFAAGASPLEAAIFSNPPRIVVGKIGTATVTQRSYWPASQSGSRGGERRQRTAQSNG